MLSNKDVEFILKKRGEDKKSKTESRERQCSKKKVEAGDWR